MPAKLPAHLLIPVAALALLAAAGAAQAQTAGDMLGGLAQTLGGTAPGSPGAASLSGRIIQLIALMTVLSIAPGLLVVMTSFTRFVIVFSMLRSALGLNQTPPNMVLSAMALFMTFFVMQPVFNDAWSKGLEPLMQNQITEQQGLTRMGAPFKAFMFVNTRPRDLALFADLAQPKPQGAADAAPKPAPNTPTEASWRILVPAFMISELRRAFTIGFLIYLPFIAIDLIVASVLMSAGMMMLPPVMISLPCKVIFFVLIDGWYMLAGSLMHSYLSYAGGG
jgi:flagellar biosynthetic protein FliP